MSLVARGMGSSQSLIMSGFGPQQVASSKVISIARGRRPRDQKIEWEKRQSLIDVYTVGAKLLTVNNADMAGFITENVRGVVDRNDEFLIKPKGKIRIVKTSSHKNIVINVLSAFRKK